MHDKQSVNPAQVKWIYLFIGIAVIINLSGILTPIMGLDGPLYAMIAKNMVLHHNYADLIFNGEDWLDKPHFPFWVMALSFNCFGFTTFAYKIPAILFLLMGAWYTYLFAKALYNKQIALWAVLILLTAQHIILSNNDVRAEPYLTGLIIAAVYHLYRADIQKSFWQLLFGCVFTACAIMTKGMFALVPIGGAMAGQFIITRQWRSLFNLRWLLAAVLILLLILPELWSLYRQFDLHPEKVIFGQKNVSGIKFFFWDSQFGRFFNTGPIKGSGDPSFFVHTTLWAFLPWSLLLFVAIYHLIKTGRKNLLGQEWYCMSGALLTFLLFSASKFQLPHYLNIVFPFFAIITAQYLYVIQSVKTVRAVGTTQTVVMVLMLMLIAVLQYFFKPEIFTLYTALLLVAFLWMLFFIPVRVGQNVIQRIIYKTLLASFIVNIYLNLAFYPSLLKYQAASEAASWVNHNARNLPVVVVEDDFTAAFEFYLNRDVKNINALGNGQLPPKPFLLYAPDDVIHSLASKGWQIKPQHTFQNYRVTRLKPSFLNRTTRDKELSKTEVVIVN